MNGDNKNMGWNMNEKYERKESLLRYWARHISKDKQ